MRSINATLKAAMTSAAGIPTFRFYQQSTGGADQHIYNTIVGYEIQGLEMHVKVLATDFVNPTAFTGFLTRGLKINGVEYLLPTNYYAIMDIQLDDKFAIFHCNILNGNKINQAADVAAYVLLNNIRSSHFQNLQPVYAADYTEGWPLYQFASTGSVLTLGNNQMLVGLLKQKYATYISAHNDVSGSTSTQEIKLISTHWRAYNLAIHSNPSAKNITSLVNLALIQNVPYKQSWIWTDETLAKHRTNGTNYHIHNLGFMPSTATWPSYTSMPATLNQFKFLIYPDFELLDGDNLNITMCGQTFKSMVKIAERFNWQANQKIPWHMEVSQIDVT